MGITHFPHGISSFGVPVLGGAGTIPQTTGTYFFVDDSGSNANDGKDTDHPFADLDYAIGQTTEDHGDVIILMPGHAQAVTATIACDKAGVTIVGLGHGEARPTFTHDGALADDVVEISADSVVINNVKLVGSGAACTALINLTGDADYSSLQYIEFVPGTTPTESITLASGADNVEIDHCTFDCTAATVDTYICCEGSCEDLRITNCVLDDRASAGSDEAMVKFEVSCLSTIIDHCTFFTTIDGNVCIDTVSDSNGIVSNCIFASSDSTDVFDALTGQAYAWANNAYPERATAHGHSLKTTFPATTPAA